MNDNFNNIILLEAIRAGIPSRELVVTLPDLRQDLVSVIDRDLQEIVEEKRVKGRFVWGDYGQGKTHFLKLMEKHILHQNFAVSYLTLNRDLGLNNLFNLFPALSSHILTKDSNIPGLLNKLTIEKLPPELLENLKDLAQNICHPLPFLIFKSFLHYELSDMILLYNALMGKKENLVKAKSIVRMNDKADYSSAPKFVRKEHLISFIQFFSLLVKSLGYKGWVILIDELEIVGRMGKVSRLNSYKNLSWLMNLNDEHSFPIYTITASAKALQEDVFYGSKKRDAEDMPQYAKERFGKQAAKNIEQFFKYSSGSQGLILKPVNRDDIVILLNKILTIHQSSIKWNYPLPDNIVEEALKRISITNKPIRQIVRMFIEILDIYSLYGTLAGEFNETLKELYDFEDLIPDTDDDGNTKGFIETSLKDMFEN